MLHMCKCKRRKLKREVFNGSSTARLIWPWRKPFDVSGKIYFFIKFYIELGLTVEWQQPIEVANRIIHARTISSIPGQYTTSTANQTRKHQSKKWLKLCQLIRKFRDAFTEVRRMKHFLIRAWLYEINILLTTRCFFLWVYISWRAWS